MVRVDELDWTLPLNANRLLFYRLWKRLNRSDLLKAQSD